MQNTHGVCSSQLGNLTLTVLKTHLNYKFRKNNNFLGFPNYRGSPYGSHLIFRGVVLGGTLLKNLVMAIRSEGKPTGARVGYFQFKKYFQQPHPALWGVALMFAVFGPFCAHVLSSRLLGRKSRNFIILSNFLNYDHDSRKLTHDTTLVEI